MGGRDGQTGYIETIGIHMSAHQYRVTLDYLGGKHAGPATHAPISFDAGNHDDLFVIIERVRAAGLTDADDAAALALGLKLFGEVMLAHRKDPLFTPLQTAFRDFMGAFKQRVQSGNEGHPEPLQ